MISHQSAHVQNILFPMLHSVVGDEILQSTEKKDTVMLLKNIRIFEFVVKIAKVIKYHSVNAYVL